MEAARSLAQRQLDVLEALLRVPTGELKATLTHVCDLIAAATGAAKVDAFLYEAARDCLVAVGSSTQPLSALQRQLGLDVLQISNGGRVVHVYKTGETFITGHLENDAEELRGIKEAMAIRSKLGVPLEIGGERRGMLMLASQQPEFFSAEDVRFMESVGSWVGLIAHRAELAEQIGRNALEQGRRAAAEELVTVLAHDLRNYLSPLGMRLELLRLRAQRESRAEDAREAEAAWKSVTRLSGLVGDLLDAARIDHGVFRMQPEELDLGRLVEETSQMLALPGHPVSVTVQEGETIVVHGDPARLRQCVENLVSNAIQKSPANSPVSIFVTAHRARPDGPIARVEVIDEGPGIPEEMLPRIFERFVSGPRQEGGLGLGLYLAKRIAAIHRGDLTVESTPGKGARFTLTLPLRAALL